RRLPLWGGGIGDAREERRTEVSLGNQLAATVSASSGLFDRLPKLGLGSPRFALVTRATRARASFQRNAGGLHHVERGGDVRLAPGRLRMDPALRRLDEVVGLAGRPTDRVVDLGVRRCQKNRGRRGAEQ